MKKILFAAALAALLPLLVSCGKQNDSEDSFKEPRFVQSAGHLVPAGGDLQSADLGEGGIYVVGEGGGGSSPSSRTKAGSDSGIKYTSGEYEVNGNVYTLKGWGTLEFDNSASGEVQLKYTPAGKDPVVVTARFSKSTANSDIFRSWRVDKTRVSTGTAAADFPGCNFREIADFFADKGHHIPDDIPANASVSTLSITGAGRILIAYGNKSVDVGSCTVSPNSATLDYQWENPSMGYSFETGHASYEFMDGKCVLTFHVRFDDGISASFTMLLSDIG